ncbi:MAG TPA: creatininase family protein [Lacipirellulaceae bacterium]|nr:creatininase family protein [Lacipirellulaceae bacterium]
MLLQDLTWPEVKSLDFSKLVVLFPTGSFEQHGPHLPFSTDTDIATAIAREIERKLSDRVLRLPTLWPGLSTHHMHFPGTMDVPQTIYIQLVTELGKSMASMGAKKVFILNGHGGNDTPLRAALRELKTAAPKTRFVFASYWTLAAKTLREVRESEMGGMGHACEMETSVMLHLHPDRVHLERAERGGPSYTDPYRKADMQFARPVFFVNEFHEVTKNGVMGYPDLASAEKGQRFFDGIVTDVSAFVEHYLTWES